MPSRTAFKVATFNCNSVRSRLPIVLDWLRQERPDCLCLQETKVTDPDFPTAAFADEGWSVVFRGEPKYNGVAVVTKEPPEDVAFGLDDGGPADEARLARVTVRGIAVVNTYVPQGTDVESPRFGYKLEWFGRLRRFFERRYRPDAPLVWCGDFNAAPEPIDVHDPKRLLGHVCYHPDVHRVLGTVRDWGFVDVFRKHHPEPGQYTFFDYRVAGALERKVGWRVDHVWATPPLAERSTDAWIDLEPRRREKASDHTFLVATFAA
jgi:exodeoxyribonuclease III